MDAPSRSWRMASGIAWLSCERQWTVVWRQTRLRLLGRLRTATVTGSRRRCGRSGRRRLRRDSANSSKLPAYPVVATLDGRRVGLALVAVRDREYEVVAISTTEPRRGVGRALMQRCFAEARARRCRRVWLVTTNNNIAAIAFYQRVGMDLRALHWQAVRASRELKPTIPKRDAAGIPIAHELEFELLLEA